MRGIGRARRNEPHVRNRACHPRVSLVDHVAVLVELQAPVEMRAPVHRPILSVEKTAVKHGTALRILDAQFHPHVVSVHSAAGEEMTDLSRAHDHVESDRLAGADDGRHIAERRHQVGSRYIEGAAGAAFR